MNTATHDEIIDTFLHIPWRHLISHNWGTAPDEHRSEWHVNADTYINGVVLTMDFDYKMGYLIEVVDRESGNVNYFAVTTFHGPDPVTGRQEHDSIWYEQPCGTFFERTTHADIGTVSTWAVGRILGMIEAQHDAQRRDLERQQ